MTTAATKRATPGPAPHTAEYRRRGWWRDETFLDDLHRQAQIRPHKLAIAGRRIAESAPTPSTTPNWPASPTGSLWLCSNSVCGAGTSSPSSSPTSGRWWR